jgi:hypothetical protein
MIPNALPPSAKLKLELLFDGVRYTDALGRAAEHAFPNYYPYRFQPGEPDPTGRGVARIPYLLCTPDGTRIRIKGNGASPWFVAGDRDRGYRLCRDDGDDGLPVTFEPLPRWMTCETSDGTPMTKTGLEMLGDMAVVNIAPGCQYFLVDKEGGRSFRCAFCTYGAPDARTQSLGQPLDAAPLPATTYRRMQETLAAAIAEGGVNNIYIVAGSMTDWREEGERYVAMARAVQEVVNRRIPVSCGSGAIPEAHQRRLRDEDLVQNACFNLEVWTEPLFAKVCPGKHRFVGYRRWIEALETAVAIWGRGHVYTAMVAGIELEPEHEMGWEAAAALALEGARALGERGIIPIYSLYWPVGGRDHPNYFANLKAYFETLNLGYSAIRRDLGLKIWDGFMTHRSAYMQLECDIDRVLAAEAVA